MRKLLPVLAALLCAAGCFNEPEPAYKTVAPETQVYLKGAGLGELTTDALLAKGQVFVIQNGMTNLASRVDALDPATLTYLNLDRNQLTNVDALVSFTGLKWLRLNENRLTKLPDLGALKSLRRVYLRGNRLTEVPETLKSIPSLTDIELSENPISEVPDWLAKREGLKCLSFNATKLSKLPEDLSAWRSLQQLQLGELKLEIEEMRRIRAALPNVRIVF